MNEDTVKIIETEEMLKESPWLGTICKFGDDGVVVAVSPTVKAGVYQPGKVEAYQPGKNYRK